MESSVSRIAKTLDHIDRVTITTFFGEKLEVGLCGDHGRVLKKAIEDYLKEEIILILTCDKENPQHGE